MDIRQEKQIESTIRQIKYRLDEGVLLQLKLQRERELERLVATKCYARKDLSLEQANKCEEYYFKNDAKLNLLGRFSTDYLSKHIAELEQCYSNEEFHNLPSSADKDRKFLACKHEWRVKMFN